MLHAGSSARRRAAEARRELMETMNATQTQLRQAYVGFNNARDEDLIDSYVFEINALQARYNYLLRQFKETEASP